MPAHTALLFLMSYQQLGSQWRQQHSLFLFSPSTVCKGGNFVFGPAHLGPLADGIQVDATIDEGGRKFPPPGFQRVGAQRHRPLALIRLDELHRLGWGEQTQNLIQHEAVVAVIGLQIPFQLQPAVAES